MEAAAAGLPELAATIANGFDDPRTLWPWWFDADEAERMLGATTEHMAHDL